MNQYDLLKNALGAAKLLISRLLKKKVLAVSDIEPCAVALESVSRCAAAIKFAGRENPSRNKICAQLIGIVVEMRADPEDFIADSPRNKNQLVRVISLLEELEQKVLGVINN